MRIDLGRVIINISQDVGYYNLGDMSASGKIYLSSLLDAADVRYIKKVCNLKYVDEYNSEDYTRLLKKQKYDIIFCDDFMLYMDEGLEKVLVDLKGTILILVDAKSYQRFKVEEPDELRIFRSIRDDGIELMEVK